MILPTSWCYFDQNPSPKASVVQQDILHTLVSVFFLIFRHQLSSFSVNKSFLTSGTLKLDINSINGSKRPSPWTISTLEVILVTVNSLYILISWFLQLVKARQFCPVNSRTQFWNMNNTVVIWIIYTCHIDCLVDRFKDGGPLPKGIHANRRICEAKNNDIQDLLSLWFVLIFFHVFLSSHAMSCTCNWPQIASHSKLNATLNTQVNQ